MFSETSNLLLHLRDEPPEPHRERRKKKREAERQLRLKTVGTDINNSLNKKKV